MIRKLEWDSDFFNLKIGEIIYDSAANIGGTDDFDLLYVKSATGFELKIPGFVNTFCEVKVVFAKTLKPVVADGRNISPFEETHAATGQLYGLAYESGRCSRFKLDKKLSNAKFEALYRKWVDNSVSKLFADEVLVYSENNKIMGFVTYKADAATATIGLIAVDPESQGKGIGGKLLRYTEQQLVNKNILTLLIPTQESNTAACNFYEKQQYRIKETMHIKHYWKNDTI